MRLFQFVACFTFVFFAGVPSIANARYCQAPLTSRENAELTEYMSAYEDTPKCDIVIGTPDGSDRRVCSEADYKAKKSVKCWSWNACYLGWTTYNCVCDKVSVGGTYFYTCTAL